MKVASASNITSLGQQGVQPLKFDLHLEALRGFAALLVILGHIFNNNFHLDPNYKITGVWQYNPPGHFSVMVFFILSGYVIGLTNQKPITTAAQRKTYLRKRLVRLYPLYLIAIVLAIGAGALMQLYFPFQQIGLHLLFGQVVFTPVLENNQPLWSLSYEIAYYLFFLILSRYQWRATSAALVAVGVGLLTRFTPVIPPVLASYSYGACFWLTGLALSQNQRSTKPLRFGLLLAWLLLMLCYERMNLLFSLLNRTGIDFTGQTVPDVFQRAISFSDLSCLIFCVPLLLRFTGRTMPRLIWLERLAFLMPSLYLVSYIISGKIRETELFNTVIGSVVFYGIAVLAYLMQHRTDGIGKLILRLLTPLGSISYGIYIIHFPILFLFRSIQAYSGSTTTFFARCIIYFGLIFALGWFLESKFQPWIKAKLA
jgi:peptidoglycan/LPS O-acetylase OafA/YrhL